MAIQYSHRQFFRHTPNHLLAAYFASNKIKIDVDFSELKETDVDQIFDAYSLLTEEEQANTEADFQDVNALAIDGGITALIDESLFHEDKGFAGEIASIDGLHAKVMWAFLEKKLYWNGATMFLHADNVSSRSWIKRNNFPNVSPQVLDTDIELFAKEISAFFSLKESRGRNCKVEPYRRHNKEYFFAYPEDFSRTGVEWVRDTLSTRSRHPAFEIIFVYCQDEGSLDIYAPRNTKTVPELQKIFAKCILNIDTLKDGTTDNRVYDLAPLKKESFKFEIEPDSGIAKIEVTHLRLTLKNNNENRRITLEADPTKNPKAVYDLLNHLDPPPYFITQVGLKVTFEPLNNKRGKTKRFNITYPNSCALNHDGTDGAIRKILSKSGLEPSQPKEEN